MDPSDLLYVEREKQQAISWEAAEASKRKEEDEIKTFDIKKATQTRLFEQCIGLAQFNFGTWFFQKEVFSSALISTYTKVRPCPHQSIDL